MENLRKLALEIAENVTPPLSVQEQAMFIGGFQECANLLAEDKKELLEALKYLVNCNTKDRFKCELPNSIFKSEELIKKHETI
jgi:hypothetical protein